MNNAVFSAKVQKMTTIHNVEIREAIKKAHIKKWQLAELMDIQDSSLSRKLRYEIQGKEKTRILNIIHEFERQQENKAV